MDEHNSGERNGLSPNGLKKIKTPTLTRQVLGGSYEGEGPKGR